MANCKKIFLITDFGSRDWYVPVMKSKILEIDPTALIIDGTHELQSFEVKSASFFLEQIVKNVAEPSIFVVVVDPGVGGKKHKRIIVKNKHWFIGPDNGVFSRILSKRSLCWEINLKKLVNYIPDLQISNTFHGRDIFSPSAGLISKGIEISEFCNKINKVFKNKNNAPRWEKNKLIGQIDYIDKFGNLISNINNVKFRKYFTSKQKVLCTTLKQKKINFLKTYSQVQEGSSICLFNSDNHIELAVNKENASKKFKMKVGDKITLYTQ